MKSKMFGTLFFGLLLLSSCISDAVLTLTVKNNSDTERKKESVIILLSELSTKGVTEFNSICFKNVKTGEIYSSQLIDKNGDGKKESILFQATLMPNSEENYQIIYSREKCAESKSVTTHSRFAPERIDDYAWENDIVAFRTFGPKAQLLFEEDRMEGKDKGTISSGIDCWFKRVNYSIIESWYKKYTENTGTYHDDTGEGLDSYHVGKSRGCGGLGVWDSVNEKLLVSKNFISWETIDRGPLRSSFILEYDPWEANGDIILERKKISLDLGSNLSKYEVNFVGLYSVKKITIGLTLHDKSGTINVNEKEGWFRYWEKIKDSEVGTGIVVDPKYIAGHTKHIVEEKDESHILIHLKPIDGKIVYYAGYGWEKNNGFLEEKDWDSYLSTFSKIIQDPLLVKIN